MGVISDVHGNLVALEAVLADMPAVDALVNAGDVVGYNPWPAACVEAMWDPTALDVATGAPEGPVPTVMGNHDRAVYEDSAFRFNDMAKAGVDYTREVLDDEHLDWLGELPDERRLFDKPASRSPGDRVPSRALDHRLEHRDHTGVTDRNPIAVSNRFDIVCYSSVDATGREICRCGGGRG